MTLTRATEEGCHVTPAHVTVSTQVICLKSVGAAAVRSIWLGQRFIGLWGSKEFEVPLMIEWICNMNLMNKKDHIDEIVPIFEPRA